MTIMQRKARSESADEALRAQTQGGLEGMIIYSLVATGVCAVLHQTWPLFRRQTLAGKAFLVSGAGMSGLVIRAEYKLQRYEYKQKRIWNEERKQASAQLAREGSVGSEEEIKRWISDQRQLDLHPPTNTTITLTTSGSYLTQDHAPSVHSSKSNSSSSTTSSSPKVILPQRFGETETELENEVLDVLVKGDE
ncbi:hypothetical protein BDY24DRAFT_381919 [Mrakia frigida]|uniref:uncharacterized protein n=1 Tax=Mrakia frigida TaxID=29902 RepID=UPI003FCC0E15